MWNNIKKSGVKIRKIMTSDRRKCVSAGLTGFKETLSPSEVFSSSPSSFILRAHSYFNTFTKSHCSRKVTGSHIQQRENKITHSSIKLSIHPHRAQAADFCVEEQRRKSHSASGSLLAPDTLIRQSNAHTTSVGVPTDSLLHTAHN